LIKQLQIPSSLVQSSEQSLPKFEKPLIESNQDTRVEESSQAVNQIESPVIKAKTKLDEVTEAAITIFGGRVLD
jgi:hypothetical protein